MWIKTQWCPGFRIKLADVYGIWMFITPNMESEVVFQPHRSARIVKQESFKGQLCCSLSCEFPETYLPCVWVYIYIYIVRDYPAKSKPQNVQGSCHGSLP